MVNRTVTPAAIALETKELLRKRPIDKISVTTICDHVGIDRKTFYRYFKDKYDVVGWIYYHDFFENMPVQPDWNIWDYFTEIQKQLYTDREFYLNAFRYRGQNSFREYGSGLLMPIIHEEYCSCFENEEEEVFFVTHALEWTYDACEKWLSMSPCPPPEEFSEHFKIVFQLFSEKSAELIHESLNRE